MAQKTTAATSATLKYRWKTTHIPSITHLVNAFDLRYSQPAAAKSAAGICTSVETIGIHLMHALSVNVFAHLLFSQFKNCTNNFNGGSDRAAFGLAGVLVGR